MLLAAGYAPVWKERDLSTPDLAAVNSALDYMLTQHEPYPAFVIDRCWNLLRANRGALSGLAMPDEAQAPVLPIHFHRDGTFLQLFTTIATLGTPRDVTLDEIRIEFFFPIDDSTAQAFKSWANWPTYWPRVIGSGFVKPAARAGSRSSNFSQQA